MDATLLEQLLYEDENATLDFKKQQYKFVKATDDEKSELLKDILGFANGWRRADAYILIGVEEVRGGRSTVVGIVDHITDHSLQQFVNNLTNRPVRFGYEACSIDGQQIGVIRIEQQERPIYLKKDYGKLKAGEVYVRRGSSTDPTKPATPDEIAQMGKAVHASSQEAELVVEFANPELDDLLGVRIPWKAEFCDVPDREQLPRLGYERQQNALGFDFSAIQTVMSYEFLNEEFYSEVATYEFVRRLYRKARFVVTNTGKVAANDVRVELTIAKGEGVAIVGSSKMPDQPRRKKSRLDIPALKKLRPVMRHPGDVDIEVGDDRFKFEMDCGSIQPGRKIWSDEFFIGVAESGEFKLEGHLYAENLPEPKPFTLNIDADITRTSMTVDDLIKLADGEDADGDVDEYEED